TMQRLPPLATETSFHPCCRRCCQSEQDHPRGEPHRDVRPLVDLSANRRGYVPERLQRENARESEARQPVQHDEGQEVERAIEKREQAEQAAESNRGVPACQPTKWGDRERNAQEPQRPEAGGIRDFGEGVCTEI